jgi:hypothetical protein
VDRQEQVLVRGRADQVCDRPEAPGQRVRFAQLPRAEDLQRDDGEHEPFRERLGSAELGDLWVRLYDGLAPAAVRLLRVGPEEVGVAGGLGGRTRRGHCDSATGGQRYMP